MLLHEQIEIPTNRLTIALHIRRGGGYLTDQVLIHTQLWQFPPDQFYLEQIRTIYNLTKKPLFAYIFTDDPHPAKIAQTFSKALSDIDIMFDYRKTKNHHALNVVEDFFGMLKFDCLIRPYSHFSMWAERLGNYKIIIYPHMSKDGLIHEISIINK